MKYMAKYIKRNISQNIRSTSLKASKENFEKAFCTKNKFCILNMITLRLNS